MAIGEMIEQPVEKMEAMSLAELAEQANEAADEIEGFASDTVRAAVRCGMLLLTAKDKVKHGAWQSWVAEHFSKDIGQARRYMNIAKQARAPVLADSLSIRDAIRRIVGPKAGSDEDKKEQIADMLREGRTQVEICEKFRIKNATVKRIYEEVVVPELLEVDWRSVVSKSLVKEMAAAKLLPAIEAEYASKGLVGGCRPWLASEINVTTTLLGCAVKILSDGIPSLIARAEAGEVAISAAGEIAKLPGEEQTKELATLDRKKVVNVVDELRSRVSHMLDQRLGWNSQYTDDESVFCDLRDNADSNEVAEIVRNLQLVQQWVSTIITVLEDR